MAAFKRLPSLGFNTLTIGNYFDSIVSMSMSSQLEVRIFSGFNHCKSYSISTFKQNILQSEFKSEVYTNK